MRVADGTATPDSWSATITSSFNRSTAGSSRGCRFPTGYGRTSAFRSRYAAGRPCRLDGKRLGQLSLHALGNRRPHRPFPNRPDVVDRIVEDSVRESAKGVPVDGIARLVGVIAAHGQKSEGATVFSTAS